MKNAIRLIFFTLSAACFVLAFFNYAADREFNWRDAGYAFMIWAFMFS